MKTLILLVVALLAVPACSTYEREDECEPEKCDGVDNDCDGFADQTRHECPDGTLVAWCQCDADQNFECLENPGLQCRDTHCDDGNEPMCEMVPPVCQDWEILAYQNYCYRCVSPATCIPWGEPGCQTDQACPPEQFCDPCATSSCPECDDCLAACLPHGCPTETDLMCYCARPECTQGGISIIQDGCWICVSWDACVPTGEGC